jgi:hypothetical protein
MLRRVALAKTEVSEECSASTIRVTRIGELRTTLAVSSSVRQLLDTANVFSSSPILITLIMDVVSFYGTPVLTRATRRNIQEDSILYSHRREKLKSYIALTGSAL